MTGARIEAVMTTARPDYRKTAAELLARCRTFYEDPENEKAYQAWKEEQKKKDRRRCNAGGPERR